MKSDLHEDRYYIECDCGSPDHILIFDICDESMISDIDYSDLSVYFSGNWKEPWYRRIKIALKYIFNTKDYACWSDAVIISPDNTIQLEDMLYALRKKRNKEAINYKERYYTLIHQVESKYPEEGRYETALRLIRKGEYK